MNERKHYLDNIRWITLCVVILYHVFYLFNSSGVVSNIGVTGIKELDAVCVFTYPWIMCLLFVVSGVSTRYSLKNIFIKQNNWIAIVSIIIGLPLGYYLTDWLFKTAIEEHYDFGAYILTQTYIISAVGTFIVSYLVSKFLARKIKNIDMVSSLKGNE